MKDSDVAREIENMTNNRMRKRCEALIIAMVSKELSEKWWNSSNKAFGGKTPEEMYAVSPDKVYGYLMRSAEGEW